MDSEILTILKSTTIKLCKTAIKDSSNAPQFTKVVTPKFFTYEHASIESLTDLYDVVSRYSTTRFHCLVRGQLRDDIDPTRRIRRKLRKEATDPNEEPFEDRPCHWLMIDIDKLTLPEGYDVLSNTQACLEYAVSQLPSEFQKASYIWHLSASAGIKSEGSLSVHLFFWLTKPWANEHLKRWAISVNAQRDQKLIDDSLFNAVQIHFIADPECVNFEDPLQGRRLGIHYAEQDEVELAFDPTIHVANRSHYTGTTVSGVGYEAKIAQLGDGPAQEGFHSVLLSATAAYVTAQTDKETALARVEDLKADVRQRINEADQSNHSQSEINRYLSDAYLDPMILGAIDKFVEDTPPYWNKSLLTLEDGVQRLHEVVDKFGQEAMASIENPLDVDPPILAIRATAGLGKTRSVIKQLLAYKLLEHGDVHYYVPNHRLSSELEADLDDELTLDLPRNDAVLKRARVIYGRAQIDGTGNHMCRKAKVAKAVSDAGGNLFKLLCDNGSAQCEFFNSCAYLNQLDEVDGLPNDMKAMLTEVKVMSHEHLFYRTKERFLQPSLVVIDESFVKNPLDELEIPIADVLRFADPDSHIAAVGNLLLHGAENLLDKLRAQMTSHDLLEELEEYESVQGSAFTALRIDDPLHKQQQVVEKLHTNKTPTLIRTLAYEMQTSSRAESNAIVVDGQYVSVLRRKQLNLPDVPTLLIDADANPDLLKQFFGCDVPVEDISVERQAEVIQFKDKTFSAGATKDGSTLAQQAAKFIEGVADTGQTLVVSNKDTKAWFQAQNIPNVTFDHFNNLRGVNLYKDYQNIVIVGRNEPSAIALEKLARGLWYDAEEPFRLLDDRSGNYPLVPEKRGYRLRDGHGSSITQVHPYWRCQALLEQMRESESTQAIDRLRLLRPHSEGLQRRVFILCSVPLDVTVDHLESWSGLQKLIALLEDCKSIVPLNPKHLMIATTAPLAEGTAKERVKDLKRMKTLISIYIRESILLTAQYRLRGQKRASEVLYDAKYSAEQVQARLAEISGEPVEML